MHSTCIRKKSFGKNSAQSAHFSTRPVQFLQLQPNSSLITLECHVRHTTIVPTQCLHRARWCLQCIYGVFIGVCVQFPNTRGHESGVLPRLVPTFFLPLLLPTTLTITTITAITTRIRGLDRRD